VRFRLRQVSRCEWAAVEEGVTTLPHQSQDPLATDREAPVRQLAPELPAAVAVKGAARHDLADHVDEGSIGMDGLRAALPYVPAPARGPHTRSIAAREPVWASQRIRCYEGLSVRPLLCTGRDGCAHQVRRNKRNKRDPLLDEPVTAIGGEQA
jgi:hypothetical protein